MARVIVRKAALRDLENPYNNIRDRNGSPVNAYRFVQRIRDFRAGLGTFPERGIRRDDIRPGLRIIVFERVVAIAVEIRGDEVTIGRIFSARRDYERVLRLSR